MKANELDHLRKIIQLRLPPLKKGRYLRSSFQYEEQKLFKAQRIKRQSLYQQVEMKKQKIVKIIQFQNMKRPPLDSEYNSNPFKSKSAIRLRYIKQVHMFLKHNYSRAENPELFLQKSKQKMITNLSQQLKGKISMDFKTNLQLSLHQKNRINRLSSIQSHLEIINRQNSQKIKQLDAIEKKFLEKIQVQIKKDKQTENKLLIQYQQVLKEQEKIRLTKQVKKIKQKEDWISIEKQQNKLEFISRQFKKKQEYMATKKNHNFKQQKLKTDEPVPVIENIIVVEQKKRKKGKKGKKQKQKKNIEQNKQIGKQYVEHSIKTQLEQNKQRINFLDIYKKIIDYLPEIKTMVVKNSQNLSKPMSVEE